MCGRVKSKPSAATEGSWPLNICFLTVKWDTCPEERRARNGAGFDGTLGCRASHKNAETALSLHKTELFNKIQGSEYRSQLDWFLFEVEQKWKKQLKLETRSIQDLILTISFAFFPLTTSERLQREKQFDGTLGRAKDENNCPI